MKQYMVYANVGKLGRLLVFADLAAAERMYSHFCEEYPKHFVDITEWVDGKVTRWVRRNDEVTA